MKKQGYYLLAWTCVSLLSFPLGVQSAGINYVTPVTSQTSENSAQEATSGKTIEEINASEHILGEQVIISISQDGYVTSHGDHYHTYNGTVPYDGIFSEAILTPADYQFNSADVISEVAEGHIVKVGKKFLLHLTDPQQKKSIRTRDEIKLQSYSIDPLDAKAIVALKAVLGLADTSKISYQLEKHMADVIQETQAKEAVVVYLMKDGYVALIGTELYVFPHQVEPDAVFATYLLTPSDYQLDSEAIVCDTAEGHVVKTEAGYRLYLAHPDQAHQLKQLDQN